MTARILMEFVVELPNEDIAKDVLTRLTREHHAHLCEVLTSIMGYEPLQSPGKLGVLVVHEAVTWNATEHDWIGQSDNDDDADEDA